MLKLAGLLVMLAGLLTFACYGRCTRAARQLRIVLREMDERSAMLAQVDMDERRDADLRR